MIKDIIVEEVRRERDNHASKFNYDMHAIYEDLKKQEKKSKHKFVTLPPKYIKKSA
ncbi:MAG: hypothetical protein NT166_05295 [Candidatus Aminicenantes bacterium]|jgi:hypothetical protein|nr:hypothetical protein [Candidatus Aminicenantes bacterium]